MFWVKRGKHLESQGNLKLCIASRRHSCMIAGYVFACVHRVWVLQTMSGVGPPWRQKRENGERTENGTTTLP